MRSGSILFVIALVLVGSCSLPAPSLRLELTIAGTPIAVSPEGSHSQISGCSGYVADSFAPVAPLTVVHSDLPVELVFSASSEVNEIRGDIFEGDQRINKHVEAFTLDAGRRHTSSSMRAGQYYIFVAISWSRLVDRGGSSRAFYVEIVPR